MTDYDVGYAQARIDYPTGEYIIVRPASQSDAWWWGYQDGLYPESWGLVVEAPGIGSQCVPDFSKGAG